MTPNPSARTQIRDGPHGKRAAMLSRWSRIARRIRVPAGFLFAAFYLWRARPSAASLAWSLLLVIPGLLLRAYASGYVKKNAELTVTGPYAYTRNPLYLGSMLMAFGFAAASRSLWITLLLALLFLIIYAPTIYGEEQFLRSAFPAFESYAQYVPRLIPRLTPAGIQATAASPVPSIAAPRVQFTLGCLCRLRCADFCSVASPLIRWSALTVIRYPKLFVRVACFWALTGIAQSPPALLAPAANFSFPG